MSANEPKISSNTVESVPVSPSGGPVVACELDKACVQVDCEELAKEVEGVMDESPDAPDYLLHYCGVDYLEAKNKK